jgi:actin-related protein
VFNPRAQRERLAALLFGTAGGLMSTDRGYDGGCDEDGNPRGAPAVYFLAAPVAALASAGRRTGVVLDVGDGVTQTAAVYEGFVVGPSLRRADLGGRDLTDFMLRLLHARPAAATGLTGPGDRAVAKTIKEEHGLCRVALDYELELRRGSHAKAAELPDGAAVTLDRERLLVPEALFRPSVMGRHGVPGVHELLHAALLAAGSHLPSAEAVADLWGNVVVVGAGGASFDGFVERLQKELTALCPPEAQTATVFSPPERRYSTWIGASTMVSGTDFEGMCITSAEWRAEHQARAAGGSLERPSVVHRKCF